MKTENWICNQTFVMLRLASLHLEIYSKDIFRDSSCTHVERAQTFGVSKELPIRNMFVEWKLDEIGLATTSYTQVTPLLII